ncbi:MAG: cupin domain-containing protein, partial [Microvirga sp.]
MPKIDIAAIPVRERTGYPPPYAEAVKGRLFQALGDAAGLTQFGVNLVRLKPGAASSQRHWHENEDEFLIVLEGELVLVEDEGETILRAGDTAGFKAGVPNGHHLLNRTERDGV